MTSLSTQPLTSVVFCIHHHRKRFKCDQRSLPDLPYCLDIGWWMRWSDQKQGEERVLYLSLAGQPLSGGRGNSSEWPGGDDKLPSPNSSENPDRRVSTIKKVPAQVHQATRPVCPPGTVKGARTEQIYSALKQRNED